MKLFVDTWGWIALADSGERAHLTVRGIFHRRGAIAGRLFTSDYVLDETFTLVFRRQPFPQGWRFVQGIANNAAQRSLTIERISPERFRKALELRQRYADKPRISFTDLTSMVIMRELEMEEILTADAHFRHVGLGFRTLPV